MHYIRFLKPPRLLPGSPPTLSAKITITTDLGESFLWADVGIVAEVVLEDGTRVSRTGRFEWKGASGMRSLEVVLGVVPGADKKSLSMSIRPEKDCHVVGTFTAALNGATEGGVVAVRSQGTKDATTPPLALRHFVAGSKEVSIWEETGESIARHIWDAGLLLSSYLANLSSNPMPGLPTLEKLFSRADLNVLELGAGCGIVGITLNIILPTSHVLLTDLPEATEIIQRNLALLPSSPAKPTHQILDWSQSLSPSITTTAWDLILIADCTYNPDVVPDLVTTLVSVIAGRKEVLVLLAMKVRHDSELVFFELMKDATFVIVEKITLPLPVLGGEDQEVEVFVFRLGE